MLFSFLIFSNKIHSFLLPYTIFSIFSFSMLCYKNLYGIICIEMNVMRTHDLTTENIEIDTATVFPLDSLYECVLHIALKLSDKIVKVQRKFIEYKLDGTEYVVKMVTITTKRFLFFTLPLTSNILQCQFSCERERCFCWFSPSPPLGQTKMLAPSFDCVAAEKWLNWKPIGDLINYYFIECRIFQSFLYLLVSLIHLS